MVVGDHQYSTIQWLNVFKANQYCNQYSTYLFYLTKFQTLFDINFKTIWIMISCDFILYKFFLCDIVFR